MSPHPKRILSGAVLFSSLPALCSSVLVGSVRSAPRNGSGPVLPSPEAAALLQKGSRSTAEDETQVVMSGAISDETFNRLSKHRTTHWEVLKDFMNKTFADINFISNISPRLSYDAPHGKVGGPFIEFRFPKAGCNWPSGSEFFESKKTDKQKKDDATQKIKLAEDEETKASDTLKQTKTDRDLAEQDLKQKEDELKTAKKWAAVAQQEKVEYQIAYARDKKALRDAQDKYKAAKEAVKEASQEKYRKKADRMLEYMDALEVAKQLEEDLKRQEARAEWWEGKKEQWKKEIRSEETARDQRDKAAADYDTAEKAEFDAQQTLTGATADVRAARDELQNLLNPVKAGSHFAKDWCSINWKSCAAKTKVMAVLGYKWNAGYAIYVPIDTKALESEVGIGGWFPTIPDTADETSTRSKWMIGFWHQHILGIDGVKGPMTLIFGKDKNQYGKNSKEWYPLKSDSPEIELMWRHTGKFQLGKPSSEQPNWANSHLFFFTESAESPDGRRMFFELNGTPDFSGKGNHEIGMETRSVVKNIWTKWLEDKCGGKKGGVDGWPTF